MVRVSFGIYSDEKDVDALVNAVQALLRQDRDVLVTKDIAVMAKPVRTLPNDRG